MTDSLLIVAALNGMRQREDCPKVPLTPAELAAEARRAVDAGAGMIHVHARNADGAATFDLIIDDLVAELRGAVDVPISLSTLRPRTTSLGTVTALVGVLRDLPEIASVHVRSADPEQPAHREEARQIIQALDDAGVRPAPVASSLDGLGDLEALSDDAVLGRAPFVTIALGAERSDAPDLMAGTPDNVLRMMMAAKSALAQLPILVAGLDGASPAVQAVGAAAGAHIRVGFEDAITLPDGTPASSNAQLVEHAVRLGAALGRSPMAADDVRRLLR